MKRRSENLALLADLYELTMAACYHRRKMFAPATFSLFIRTYPPNRRYFVSAGLEEVLRFLESFHFDQEDLDFLQITRLFPDEFLHHLAKVRFSGEVFAIPEGRLFFQDEPILEITTPIMEAQLIESFVMNAVNLEVTIATKAARCVHAAQGRPLVDFSLRRTHGIDPALDSGEGDSLDEAKRSRTFRINASPEANQRGQEEQDEPAPPLFSSPDLIDHLRTSLSGKSQ